MKKTETTRKRLAALLTLTNAFAYMCPAAYATFLSAFYKQSGLTGTQMGILFGISPVMYILVQPWWGRLADRTGKRRLVLMIICLGTAAALCSFYLGNTFASFLFSVLSLSLFTTSLIPVCDSIVIVEAKKQDIPFSFIRLGGTIGYAIVVLICGVVFTERPERMFAVAAIMFVLFAMLTRLLPKDGAGGSTAAAPAAAGVKGLRNFITREFVLVLLFGLCGYIGLSFCMAYTGTYLVELGYNQSVIGLASAISALSEIPTLLFVNRVSKKIPISKILVFSCVATGFRTLMVGSGVLWMILTAQLLQGVTYMLLYYCCVMYISTHLPEQWQSSGQSLLVMVQSGFGSLSGYILGGRLIDAIGIHDSYIAYGLLTLVCSCALALALIVMAKKKRGLGV